MRRIGVDDFGILTRSELGITYIDLYGIAFGKTAHVTFGEEPIRKKREQDKFGKR
jgi:hypothetical protein